MPEEDSSQPWPSYFSCVSGGEGEPWICYKPPTDSLYTQTLTRALADRTNLLSITGQHPSSVRAWSLPPMEELKTSIQSIRGYNKPRVALLPRGVKRKSS